MLEPSLVLWCDSFDRYDRKLHAMATVIMRLRRPHVGNTKYLAKAFTAIRRAIWPDNAMNAMPSFSIHSSIPIVIADKGARFQS
jgi:hypothetical protein